MPDEATAASAIDAQMGADDQNQPDETNALAAHEAGEQGVSQTNDDVEADRLRHADYTRKTQELAEQRREFEAQQEQATKLQELAREAFLNGDEEAANQFLEAIGYEAPELDDYGQPVEVDPEVAALKAQVAEMSEFVNTQKEQQANAEKFRQVDSDFYRLTGEGFDESNPDHDTILGLAAFNSADDGPINVEAGYKAFNELRERIINDYRQGKSPAASNEHLTGTPASAALSEHATPEDKALSIMEAHGF